MHKPDFKIITLGEAGVGKSSLIYRFTENTFAPEIPKTTGINTQMIDTKINNQVYKVQIDDTAGDEKYQRILSPNYFRRVDGILLVYDLSEKSTVKGLQKWVDQISQFLDLTVDIVIIGNKADLAQEADIREGEKIASNFQRSFIHTSCKTGMNVPEAFTMLITQVASRKPKQTMHKTISLASSSSKNSKKKCC